MNCMNYFNEGRMNYKSGNFPKAIVSFQECLKANKKDDLANTYINRCKKLINDNPGDWSGVWVMNKK